MTTFPLLTFLIFFPLVAAALIALLPRSAEKSARLYATLAAQRASKILGIFARLDRRDGKPQYLRHIPRVWGYLQRSLAHPALAMLHDWYSLNVPAPESAPIPPPQT